MRAEVRSLLEDAGYDVLRALGEGSFACPHLLSDVDSGAELVAKYAKDSDVSSSAARQLANEHAILDLDLHHENVIKFLGALVVNSERVIFLEYAPGGDLLDAVNKDPALQPVEMRNIMQGLASGVAYLHQQKVLHRDLKLENVLLRNGGVIESPDQIAIADFGLAMSVDNSATITVCDAAVGTAIYVAPELISIEEQTGAEGSKVAAYYGGSDVWALGVICFILYAGKYPGYVYNQEGEEVSDGIILQNVCGGALPDLSMVPDEAVRHILSLIFRYSILWDSGGKRFYFNQRGLRPTAGQLVDLFAGVARSGVDDAPLAKRPRLAGAAAS